MDKEELQSELNSIEEELEDFYGQIESLELSIQSLEERKTEILKELED